MLSQTPLIPFRRAMQYGQGEFRPKKIVQVSSKPTQSADKYLADVKKLILDDKKLHGLNLSEAEKCGGSICGCNQCCPCGCGYNWRGCRCRDCMDMDDYTESDGHDEFHEHEHRIVNWDNPFDPKVTYTYHRHYHDHDGKHTYETK